MSLLIGFLVVLALAALAFVLINRRRETAGSTHDHVAAPAAPAPTSTPRPEPEPMTGLESALAQATDSEGRPIKDRLDSEHIDDLRVPDDTGPLLRRALDHVEHDEPEASDAVIANDGPGEPPNDQTGDAR